MSWRLELIKIFIIFAFFCISIRLFQLMILDHSKYQVMAQRQHIEERVLLPNRGEIYASDGYKLVVNSPTYLLFAVPKEMNSKELESNITKLVIFVLQQIDKEDVQNNISVNGTNLVSDQNITPPIDGQDLVDVFWPASFHTLKVSYAKDNATDTKLLLLKEYLNDKFTEKLNDINNEYVQLFEKLTPLQKKQIEDFNIDGLFFQLQYRRQYPESKLASQILGFVGKDEGGADQGYFGLEGYYDRYLSGKQGYEIIEKDIEGKIIPFGVSKLNSATQGRDLVLTIRREFQYILERKLDEALVKYKCKNAMGVILDPNTGAIWALANIPSYYPGYWTDMLRGETDVSKIEEFQNLITSATYEPGSVMKPITMAIGINEGLITPDLIYDDNGPVVYSGYAVQTWNNQYHGKITMTQILELSDNTGAAWVGTQIGKEKLYSYFTKFNFGKVLKVDIQGEEQGIMRDINDLRDIDIANMSFGQGISVTPLQMVTAFAAVINGGKVYRPYLVDQMLDPSGYSKVIQIQPTIINKIISEKTSTELRYMLEKVVTDGEFKWFVKQAGMNEYRIGGKTGTAQIPFEGRYDPNKTNTTFIGFAPVQSPVFVMLVRVSEPTTSTSSADTVVPLWMDIAKEMMPILGIPPTQ